ncbi:sensor histidine kinase [Mucilaginibacter phyllosphaerae]|uniref:histidine kinase n=1 Tax=Mucilaginibacter phyllosphaerae TaxID=1812349 RepID=A0A4Y8A7J3_9SPHI|nr:HAMP domain-containing sensor histidine kinase [Mucilaginibacter phyllosphaerae]MBB3970738.1 signal transduction histidine kinase [Mucilaginibacter phyllosphaerae]TEW64316.1 HAMP domain-containing histidine kinase [Mucilaginibacter phyllosphaerae]GGH04330.1 hypothetical protein GCM10007352_07430 [Mucilaginibacter phyllosphaerae]
MRSPVHSIQLFLTQIKKHWERLVGHPDAFKLESRVFHSISISLIIVGIFYIPYNYFAKLYIASLSSMVICIVFGIQFYYSRFRGRMHSSTVFGLTGVIVFSITYFFTSGIYGSTDLIWPAYLLLVLTISPYRQHLIWLSIFLLVFSIIHVIDYAYPHLVKHPFNTGKGMFIDRVTAFPIPVLAVFVIVRFFRRSYERERNIAEQKTQTVETHYRQILQQKNELEQTNAEKNKLMSIISHDFRSPLVNIQNYLELLNETELDDLQRRDLEKSLLTATNQTMSMLSNLLYWSKTQLEGTSVNLQPVNLQKTLQGTLEMEQIQAKGKNILFYPDIDSRATVIADADMLQLVVRNLISNAIKFTPVGGTIRVDTKISAADCTITISDTGQGIPLQKQAALFSFSARPSYGTNHEKGVGLGLLLCKEFMERQNGKIGFESTAASGSSFYIVIPLAG